MANVISMNARRRAPLLRRLRRRLRGCAMTTHDWWSCVFALVSITVLVFLRASGAW